jgi:hypothetical protein
VSTESGSESSADRLRQAEEEVVAILEQYSKDLSQQLDDGVQDAIRRRLAFNIQRLRHRLPLHSWRVKHALLADAVGECAILIEGERELGQWHYPQEPDKHYLELVRRSLGPKFRVWVEHRRTLGGWDWMMLAKYLEWPDEHQSATSGQIEKRHRRRGRRH